MRILGLMSGSSLDGLDVALLEMETATSTAANEPAVRWELLEAATMPFSETWYKRLHHLPDQNGVTLARAHTYFGHYMGELVNEFLHTRQLPKPALIASHGHTVFHEPARNMTLQIGCGAALAATTGCEVACDFRTTDIALGGQGAPFAPLADARLFGGYDFYLNLGGIANLSARVGEGATARFVAFDFAPACQPLNRLADELGLSYDPEGSIARTGQLLAPLNAALHALEFYNRAYPRSLGNDWVRESFTPIVLHYAAENATIADKLHTVAVHIAEKLADAVREVQQRENSPHRATRLLATGGGVLNTFLLEQMRAACAPLEVEIVVPDANIVHFKEAILMALMGLLRKKGLPNTLPTVTGARQATCGGALYAAPL